MNVLIISRTRMTGGRCVSGLIIDNNQTVRLLRANGANQPNNTAYNIGQIWDLDFRPNPNIIPPHIEDVLVTNARYVADVPNVLEFLTLRLGALADRCWRGRPQTLFGGTIRATANGSGYIAHPNIPAVSTGFWIPDQALRIQRYNNRVRYRYTGTDNIRYLTYVGDAEPIDVIPANTLVRVSLARWWRPPDAQDMEKRCYLQLSGWYI